MRISWVSSSAPRRIASVVGVAAVLCATTSLAAAGVAAAAANAGAAVSARGAATYSAAVNIPPRLQWNENFGYCGEVAFISAGLYYGQYLSQYDARATASSKPQNKSSSQLLLGVNDTHAAAGMHLGNAEWNTSSETSTQSFLTWVKSEIIAGYPVAIGVYTNERLFYGNTNPNAGDPDYDHIVVVTGITSQYPLTGPAAYHASDVLTFSDNGLWTGTPSGQPQYTFSYPFGSFPATRQQANAANGSVYSLASDGSNYGIALTGVADASHETVPVRVTTSVNYESPEIADGSSTRPALMPLTVTATVSGLQPGTAYHLYRYDSLARVPGSAFNANAAQAAQVWSFTATGSSYTVTQNIQSDDEVIYRAVPASAP